MTMALMESLLATKERLGYMACPCRLANGTFEADRDIVCPCEYRAADMDEYGACFCGLYVTKEWNWNAFIPSPASLTPRAGENRFLPTKNLSFRWIL